jgi:cytidylate kinase
VVFPQASAKFFLTATTEVRAKRRFDELSQRGETVDLEHLRKEVMERDHRDSTRPVAPLKQADDAELVDSSTMSIDEVVAHMVARVRAVEATLNE